MCMYQIRQGPFTNVNMSDWHQAGYLMPTLQVQVQKVKDGKLNLHSKRA